MSGLYRFVYAFIALVAERQIPKVRKGHRYLRCERTGGAEAGISGVDDGERMRSALSPLSFHAHSAAGVTTW